MMLAKLILMFTLLAMISSCAIIEQPETQAQTLLEINADAITEVNLSAPI